ncbi:armadillo repeat-containing protein 2 [Helicoverpa zea]|uniref:armadillo repeat-containing protein 2 n=1 Tax=Helicoverpa zea TaxID=7113 RepID=UPI001F58C024|nr:armadillo repeat-containing protein 2 [Helicoverpa zea]
MSERGARRGAGAPFYAPLRRKTSAEIISEARAAIYGEMSSTSGGGGVGGSLRPLRTRRPYTPREPQRSLFTERANKKEPRPPSGFDLKYLSLSESGEESLATMDARIAHLDEEALNEMLADTHNNKKKPAVRKESRPAAAGDVWGGFTKLPHLSGRSKPLHRRNTTGQVHVDDMKPEMTLSRAISIRPLGDSDGSVNSVVISDALNTKSDGSKRKQFASSKATSCDATSPSLGKSDFDVKHLAVTLPNYTSADNYENMTVLELTEALSQRSRDVERTLQLLEAVIQAVSVATPGTSLRELLLRSLYTHADSDDERLLVAVARAMLTMRVTGTHLAAACKLVFKIAKNDKNDHFFRNTNLLELLVEGCGRAEPLADSACCVYGAAALRVLALEPRLCARAHRAGAAHLAALHLKILNNAVSNALLADSACCVYGAAALRVLALEPRLCARAHRAGAAHLAALHLKILNNAKAESPRSLGEQGTHALYQVTGALRSLAGAVDQFASEFLDSGALTELISALSLHTDRDVLTNVARCLSVVSGSAECCAWLCGAANNAHALVRALAACAPRAPLAVRLAYTLGNMAAADERARNHIYNEDGAIDVFLTILESYAQRNPYDPPDVEADPDLHLIGTDLGGSDGSNEDVLIKTVRVVANLCLAERVGRALADLYAERTVNALLACLQVAEKTIQNADRTLVEHSTTVERGEELATAALATLNNLTFYREPPDPPDPLHVPIDNICKATCRWLRGTGPASCEAVRALGNVSRATRTAQLIVLEGALDRLEPFLQHEESSVRCAAAGVLVNVCGAGADGAAAAALAARALAAAARRRDPAPAPLLARALWNAHAHEHAPLSPIHAHLVTEALAMFIDDESVFVACEAAKMDRDASDPTQTITKHHVTFDMENNNYSTDCDPSCYSAGPKRVTRTDSVDHADVIHHDVTCHDDVSRHDDVPGEDGDATGEDLGFEDGDADECPCDPCRRLATWDELVGVAIPLMERLRPPRTDASVGTE